MLLGMLSSLAAAFWKFMMPAPEGGRPPERLYNITGRIRDAATAEDLDRVEDEIDEILRTELSREKRDDTDASALQIALSRLEYLVNQRRRILETAPAQTPPA
jgi:hypothetical protein